MERPISADGIPAEKVDPEWALKPLEERMRGNPAEPYVRICTELGFGRKSSVRGPACPCSI